VFASAVALVLLLSATSALASPLSDKRAQAIAVKAQVDALNQQLSIANERYNQATIKLAKIDGDVSANGARLRKLERRLGKLDTRLDTRAANMYRSGPMGFLEVLAGSTSFDQFATNWELMTQMSQDDASMLATVKDVRSEAKTVRAKLQASQSAAQYQLKARSSAVADNKASLSKRKTLLKGVQAEVAQLEAEQARREAAAAAAAARAAASRSYSSSSGGGSSVDYGSPTIPAHGNVVDFAKSRLGCPYVWAASGPGSFDCSGLTMWAYAKIGISLPHSSAEQINCGQRVSRANLQPGDLVFFGSPIHHVGMYVGGGQMIEAPYSGASVRIRSMDRGDYAGACRPG
jgi:cell wall-associated NlpC family hydrolase